MTLAETVSQDRTDRQIFDRESITVTLAGQEYEIKPTTKTRAAEFRVAVGKHKEFVTRAVELFRIAMSKDETVKPEDIANILIMAFSEKLDQFYELVYIYCPNIEADREQLDDRDTGASDHEWQIALWSVLKITSGPFVRALGLTNGSGSGLLAKLSALGVEYKKRKPIEPLPVESTNGIETDETPSPMPDSPENGTSSPEKSTGS